MNLDDRQHAPGPLVHRPRYRLVDAAALFSPSARVAGAVALERQGGERVRRLASVRNWRCRLGEIDIVAAEAGEAGLTLVFCEMKC
jgi:Uncharacterised protein family UPF0102